MNNYNLIIDEDTNTVTFDFEYDLNGRLPPFRDSVLSSSSDASNNPISYSYSTIQMPISHDFKHHRLSYLGITFTFSNNWTLEHAYGFTKKQKTKCNSIEPLIVNNQLIFDIQPLVDLCREEHNRRSKIDKEERIKAEERKLNTLSVAGRLDQIGIPIDYATITNEGQLIKIHIPNAQPSEKFKSYILLEICKTKRKSLEVDDDTKVNINFLNEHITGNRKPKIVPFKNLTLSAAIDLIASFKKVYFKDKQ